jgi:hypothetical protein
MYTITDRGPNQDCGDLQDRIPPSGVSSGKGFPLEKFAPSISEIVVDEHYLSIKNMFSLKYDKPREKYGIHATGRGNKDDFVIYEGAVRGGQFPL